jgi:hypothetical protein
MFIDIIATSASVFGVAAFSAAALAVISGYHSRLLDRVRLGGRS